VGGPTLTTTGLSIAPKHTAHSTQDKTPQTTAPHKEYTHKVAPHKVNNTQATTEKQALEKAQQITKSQPLQTSSAPDVMFSKETTLGHGG